MSSSLLLLSCIFTILFFFLPFLLLFTFPLISFLLSLCFLQPSFHLIPPSSLTSLPISYFFSLYLNPPTSLLLPTLHPLQPSYSSYLPFLSLSHTHSGPFASAMGRVWHPEHFTCNTCHKQLNNTTFVFEEEQIFCESCYEKTFAKTCYACHKPILGVGTYCSVMVTLFLGPGLGTRLYVCNHSGAPTLKFLTPMQSIFLYLLIQLMGVLSILLIQCHFLRLW